ncbi:MAG TPA: serine hydrolase [Candidatus Polarisedimenticolia bacterium]|nr:serine hydrolase [Candidatus Polarisedimenticolia bacterium]
MPAAAVDQYLEARIAAGDFPGASYLIAEGDRVLAEAALGHAVLQPERIPAALGTIYDLASLTKPLACALLAAILEAEGGLRFDDRLSRHLRGWTADDERADITLLDLLTHRAGLPAWEPLYLHAAERTQRVEWLRTVPLAHPPGAGVTYSCPNYILLGFALEAIGGAPLDRLFAEKVARPLALSDLLYRPPASLRRRIAATEIGNVRERRLAGPAGDRYNGWRTEVIWGEVHDNNAHTLGGVSGNAGLFGSARAVHALALQFLGPGLLDGRRRAMFTSDLTPGLGESRGIGFQIATTPGCSAGPALSGAAFGHTGFTGTSLWIDPETRRVDILLTNRVHPRYRDIEMNAIRRQFHRIAADV